MNAIAYIRVSSDKQSNGDGPDRQRDAIARYAKHAGHEVEAEFPDMGVSGADPVRPQLEAALEYAKAHDIKLLLVESSDRWARDLMVGETLLMAWRDAGVRVVAVDGNVDLTNNSDPQAVMIRQILASVAQNAKALLVGRMAAGRARVRAATGKCEGRKKLPRCKATTHILRLGAEGLTYREIASQLSDFKTPTGLPWTWSRVAKEWDSNTTAQQREARRQLQFRIKNRFPKGAKA